MKPDLQAMATAALERIVSGVSEQTSLAVHRQAKAYLAQ
jgi:hypothetical protein